MKFVCSITTYYPNCKYLYLAKKTDLQLFIQQSERTLKAQTIRQEFLTGGRKICQRR